MRTPILLSLLVLAATPLPAEVYRWVDENGVTVYSQTPPPSGQAERIEPPPPPAEDPAVARQRLQKLEQRLDDIQEDRTQRAEKQRQTDEKQRVRESNCRAARSNLERLTALGRRLVKLPDGQYVRLTEEERQTRLQQARAQIKENCD